MDLVESFPTAPVSSKMDPRAPGYEFGEKILWRANVEGSRKNKLYSVWDNGVYVGQLATAGECIMGAKDGMFRPCTMVRVPGEKRGVDNLSFVTCRDVKLTEEHGADKKVFLDAKPPELFMQPEKDPSPPTAAAEPVTRRQYVKT